MYGYNYDENALKIEISDEAIDALETLKKEHRLEIDINDHNQVEFILYRLNKDESAFDAADTMYIDLPENLAQK